MSEAPPLRVAVVGASSGLGRCIAMGLAEGCRVAFLARRQERLGQLPRRPGNGAAAWSAM